MDFNYIVKAETIRVHDTNEDLSTEKEFTDKFTDKNPLVARDNVYKRAKSFEENFITADQMAVDHFFREKNEFYNEFIVKVFFVNP